MFKLKKNNLVRLASLLAILLFLSSLITVLRKPLLNVLKFPLGILTLLRHEAGGIVFYHRNLAENELLKKEIYYLKQKLLELDDIYRQNQRLSQLLAFKQKLPYEVIAARVIGRSPDNWSSLVTVDKGSYHGVERGFVVITYAGLVGRVTEAARYTSKITLINDPDFSVSAIIQRSRQEALVSGTLGSYLIMKYLPKDSDVKVNDTVLTSGLTGIYPKGLSIGSVVEIGEEFSGLSHYAVIRPMVNLSNIEEVLIVVP